MDIILVGRGGLWHTDDTKQLYIILIKAWKIKDVHALVRMDEKNCGGNSRPKIHSIIVVFLTWRI